MNLLRSLMRANETSPVSITDWAKMFRPGAQFTYNGRTHQGYSTALAVPGASAYESNAVVFACEAKRVAVFSEARFQFQQMRQGRPGDLFGTEALKVLEEPWPGATTRDLLAVCELDVMKCGNSYWIRGDDGFLVWLDPARMKILTSAYVDPTSGQRVGEQLLGYGYVDGPEVTTFSPQEVAHYKPIPNGRSRFLGASWLSPCLPDVAADDAFTSHKQTVRDGANLTYVVSLDKDISDVAFERFVAMFRAEHEGPGNQGKTLFLGGGADVKTVGQSFENLALKATQGAGESRIAACAGTPPVLVGLSEGLQGSSLNQGNYASAKRAFADTTVRPLWGSWAGAFEWVVSTPASSRLWYDDRDVAFLREDVTDQATIFNMDASTIKVLIEAGFNADAVLLAAAAGDLRRLIGQHSGMVSVQLQKPGSQEGQL